MVDAALEATGIWPTREYVQRRQAKMSEYVAGRLIYKLFIGA